MDISETLKGKELYKMKMEDNYLKENILNIFISEIERIVDNNLKSSKTNDEKCTNVALSILELIDGKNPIIPIKILLSLNPQSEVIQNYNGLSDNIKLNDNIDSLHMLYNLSLIDRIIMINHSLKDKDKETYDKLRNIERSCS